MTNKINIVSGLLAMTVLTFGLLNVAGASTYEYVNTSGNISTVIADSASVALTTANNLAVHSGVIKTSRTDQKLNQPSNYDQGQTTSYAYVNTSGEVIEVNANTSAQAFTNSDNIALHSGVMLINSASDESMVGDTVRLSGM